MARSQTGLHYIAYTDIEDGTETEYPGRELKNRHWTLQHLSKFFERTRASRSFKDVFSEVRRDLKSSSNDSSWTGPITSQHKSLRLDDRVVWISDDPLGISNDAMSRNR